MPALVFTIEGDISDLDWLRTRIEGAIQDLVDENVDDGGLAEGAVEVGWTWDD